MQFVTSPLPSLTPQWQLVDIVQEVLQTGILPSGIERQLLLRMLSTRISAQEKLAIDQLTEALGRGLVRSGV